MGKTYEKSADIVELQARKKALKQEMEQIQNEIETSLTDVRTSVTDRAQLRFWIEKYPLRIAGSAFIAGFLLVRSFGGSKKTDDLKSGSGSSGNIFTGLLFDEIKKLASRRAVNYVVSRIEETIENRKEKTE